MAKKPKKAVNKSAAKVKGKPDLRSFFETGWFVIAVLALLLLFTLVLYGPTLKVPFHYDDTRNILANSYIRITRLSPSSLFAAAFQDFKHNRPLPNLSFALNYYFDAYNPGGYHLVNVFLHFISALTLFLLLDRLLARKLASKLSARLAAALTALLWLAHPINTQAVTYIVQRESLMAGCFSLLCLLGYDLGRSKKNILWYALCAGFGFCALASKETAFVLPVFILLYELWFFSEFKPGWFKKCWKWMAALSGFGILGAAAIFRAGMAAKLKADFSLFNFTPMQRLLTQGRVLIWYITMIIFPAGSRQSLEHGFATSTTLFHPLSTLPAYILVFGLVGLALMRARKNPFLSFAVLWYFGWLFIESMPLPIDMAVEHRLYLSSIAVIALMPVALLLTLKNRSIAVLLAVLIILSLAALSWERNKVWLSEKSLWEDSAFKSATMARPWNNYCSNLLEESNYHKALTACRKAALLDPAMASARNNLGSCLFHLKRFPEAEPELLKAVEMKPDFTYAYINLGLVQGTMGKFEESKTDFRKALATNPADPDVYVTVGSFLEQLNDPQDALAAYTRALAVKPDLIEARAKAATILASQSRCEEAQRLVRESPVRNERLEDTIKPCEVK